MVSPAKTGKSGKTKPKKQPNVLSKDMGVSLAASKAKSSATQTPPDKITSYSPQGDTPNPNVRADPLREYVAGGGWARLSTGLYRSLPKHIDDLTADFGDDLYDRMLFDPAATSGVNLIKLAVLDPGPRIINRYDARQPDYEEAEAIVQFCRRNLDNLERPFMEILFELLDAIAFGNKVGEQNYKLVEGGIDNLKLCLRSIKVKPRWATAFVVDPYMNIAAIYSIPGPGMQPATFTAQGLTERNGNASDLPGLGQPLPREKFIVFSFRTRDGNPRGTSLLRAAYNAWWLKMQVWPEYLKYLAQFAGPSLVGMTAEGATSEPTTVDGQGNITNAVMLTPEEVMATALEQFKNGTILALPYGSSVDAIQMAGEGGAFTTAIRMLDEQITRSILYQTGTSSDGGDASIHQDTLDMVILHAKTTLAYAIRNDILRPLVEYNFGQRGLELLPDVTLSQTPKQDVAALGDVISQLWKNGFIDDSQVPGLDGLLGLPPRDMAAWTIRRKEEEIARIAIAGHANPQQTGGEQGQQDNPAKQKANPNEAQQADGGNKGAAN